MLSRKIVLPMQSSLWRGDQLSVHAFDVCFCIPGSLAFSAAQQRTLCTLLSFAANFSVHQFSAYFTLSSHIKIMSGLKRKIIGCTGIACSTNPLFHQALVISQEHSQSRIPLLAQFNNPGEVRPYSIMPRLDMLCLDPSSEPLGRITAWVRR